uniref:Uncharacterized protein n=1 Tax=Noccaea caerulescens TaxID=107243 RepID=A0A1J3JFI6_NOCCA
MATDGIRFSKRQAGMEATPIVERKRKKNKKVPEVTENVPTVEDTHIHEHESEEGDNAFVEDDYGEADVGDAEDIVPAEEETMRPHTEQVSVSAEEEQTQQSEASNKKKRGPTKMRKVAKHHDDKVEVEFTSVGEHVSIGSVTLSSFLGPLVREHVPVLLDDWRHLDEELRDTLWEEVQAANASAGRVHICDWNLDGEIIGEGILCSTNPKDLVNNIPLGPNAAIVKVVLVLKEKAFLWRPSAEMSEMGDALNENIAWPMDKVQLMSPATPAEETSRKSHASASNSTSISKGVKQRCILLDCNGSGETVAQGRISSTDPADKVHFVPLGLNASKVWVEVSKRDSARVWRPNSEVEFISDAIGTTVAWPNDKLILQ